MSDKKTREPQYQSVIQEARDRGLTRLGLMINDVWVNDPRRAVFVLARYKFVAKMLSGKARVLEVGCADAFASRIVQQEVGRLTAVDFDPVFVEDVRERMDARWPLEVHVHDMVAGPFGQRFDAAYCIDVLEHVMPADEDRFLANIIASLEPNGTLIVGIPSLESQAHASPQSREGHVNCKSGKDFRRFLAGYFDNVFLFSMNDEVVHTGFTPMAHYLFAICCNLRPDHTHYELSGEISGHDSVG